MKAMWQRPELRACWSAGAAAAWQRPGVRARWRAALKASAQRPEVQARKSAALKAARQHPEVQARMSAATKAGHARLVLDHDHVTHLVRAALCQACNMNRGDDARLLRLKADYLEYHATHPGSQNCLQMTKREQYILRDDLRAQQNYCCAICGAKEKANK
jgi:recombination endonuclease VII